MPRIIVSKKRLEQAGTTLQRVVPSLVRLALPLRVGLISSAN